MTDDYLKLNLCVHTFSADLPCKGSDGYKLIQKSFYVVILSFYYVVTQIAIQWYGCLKKKIETLELEA